MEAAGGIKSTIEDLRKLYTAFLRDLNSEFRSGEKAASGSVFRGCRDIVAAHAWFPGPSFREQSYGGGFARAELPGQLGRFCVNAGIAPQPVVGKASESRLVLYHHGSMPGSLTNVYLLPEMDAFVVTLQNALTPIDVPDFVSQYLLETFLDVKEPNDYVQIARDFTAKALGYMDRVNDELLRGRRNSTGTSPRSLDDYTGVYWNSLHNFCIEVSVTDGKLQMRQQGRASETFELKHYQDDTFSWFTSYDEVARRGRYIHHYSASYYLIRFSGGVDGVYRLEWAWDGAFPDEIEVFTR